MIRYLKYFALRYIYRINTPKALIKLAAKLHKNKILFIDGNREVTMKEINHHANSLSHSLIKLGLKKGDRVAVWLQNRVEFIEIRLACYKCGFVFCAMLDDFDDDQVIELIDDTDSKILMHDDRVNGNNITKFKKAKGLQFFVKVTESENSNIFIAYSDLLKSSVPDEPKIKVKPAEISAIGFTSGTTGKSKAVVWSHKAWLYSFYHFMINLGSNSAGRMVMLHVVPYSTAGSLSILPALISGSLSIIMKTFEVEKVAEAIDHFHITHLILPPAFLIDLWDYHLSLPNRFSFRSLKNITVGSAPLPSEKWKEMIGTFGPIITQSYGMAEVLAPICNLKIASPAADNKIFASVGRPVKQVKIKFKNTGNYGYGAILLYSRTSCLGYWDRGRIIKTAFCNQWFTSTDVGYADEDNNLYIVDRLTNIQFVKGKTIIPRDIEEILHGFHAIKEAVVITEGETLTAIISVQRNKEVSEHELHKYFLSAYPNDLPPVKFKFVSHLPHSTSGKVLKNKQMTFIQNSIPSFD